MPTYTDPVFIDGNQDDPQLRVQAHTTQTDPLQTWEDSGNNVLGRVSGDGRLELGALNVAGAPSALIEANQNISASSSAKQGIQSRGITNAAVAEPLTWSVHELELQGTGGVSDLETALRAKVTHSNTGNSQNARLRAGDFQVVNQAGNGSQPINEAVTIQATVTNSNSSGPAGVNKVVGVRSVIQHGDTDDVINEAIGFEVAPQEDTGGAINNFYGMRISDITHGINRYAIHTGQGQVHFGDSVVLENAGSNQNGNSLEFRRAQGSPASKTLVNNGDTAGRLSFEAWDGSAYQRLASIDATVAATPGANDMPGHLVFSVTPDGSVTPAAALTINPDGTTDLTIADFTNSVHNHQNAAGGGTLNATAIGSGTLALARGGTNADLSATGGAGQVLKQSSSGGTITVATLSPSDIPSLPSSQITSGQLALEQGGTGANLNGTGGANRVVMQESAGAALTVRTLASADLPDNGVTNPKLADMAALTVKVRPTNSAGDPSDLAFTADGQLLVRRSSALTPDVLVAADIPDLAASKITSGKLPLARGGTNADLSATGGTGQVLKQTSSGAAITVGTIASADIATALTTPGAIGGTTPSTGAFTRLNITGSTPNGLSALTIGGVQMGNDLFAVQISPSLSTQGAAGLMQIQGSIEPTSTLSHLYGILFIPTVIGSSSHTITQAYGLFLRIDTGASYTGTLTNLYGLFIATPNKGNVSATMTNMYGLYIQNQDDYAIYTNSGEVRIGGAFRHAGSTFGALGVAPTSQQVGGASTAGATWTAVETAMLNKAYGALRTFGFLS